MFLTKPSDFTSNPLARASLAGIILGLLRALLAKPFFKRLLSWFIYFYCAVVVVLCSNWSCILECCAYFCLLVNYAFDMLCFLFCVYYESACYLLSVCLLICVLFIWWVFLIYFLLKIIFVHSHCLPFVFKQNQSLSSGQSNSRFTSFFLAGNRFFTRN